MAIPFAAAAGPTSTTMFVLMRPGHYRLSLMNFRQHSSLTFRFPRWSWASEPYMPGRNYRSTREVRIVNGACLMVQADVFRSIGGFDEASLSVRLGAGPLLLDQKTWTPALVRPSIMHEEHHTTV